MGVERHVSFLGLINLCSCLLGTPKHEMTFCPVVTLVMVPPEGLGLICTHPMLMHPVAEIDKGIKVNILQQYTVSNCTMDNLVQLASSIGLAGS